jgi:hypothetical protein
MLSFAGIAVPKIQCDLLDCAILQSNAAYIPWNTINFLALGTLEELSAVALAKGSIPKVIGRAHSAKK